MKRKAQGAIEYLFMMAAVLVIILIVWRQISNRGQKAGQLQQEAENSIANSMEQAIQSSGISTSTTTSP